MTINANKTVQIYSSLFKDLKKLNDTEEPKHQSNHTNIMVHYITI